MISTLDRRQARPNSWASLARVLMILSLAVGVVACGGKSEAQLASEALGAGVAAYQSGNIDEATKQYKECIKHDPTNKVCLYDLGLIAHTQNRLPEAEQYYRQSLSSDPSYTPAIFNLAILRTNLGDKQEAVQLYRRYVALKPDDASGHLNLGLLLRTTGERTAGDAEIALAQQLDPKISVPLQSPSASSAPTKSASPEPSE
jgi:tetratricopeptide (TPR) repeat protein